ncbi:MAG: DUF2124 family protein [Euryarchaeota archaeon]|nr:DUF2124 family protein [Euryarchaeota archaeon]
MEKRVGIAGLTSMFKESVSSLPNGAIVAFTGSIAVCTPFAELLAYAVKGREFNLAYIPQAEASRARRMEWMEGVGFSVTREKVSIGKVDALVVLGGLAMPKFGQPVESVASLIEMLGNPLVIGICFMSIFERSGWVEKLPFDVIINADMEVEASYPEKK